jgi:hypothetical protein
MPTNPKETAEFIRTMLAELTAMARNAKLDSLSYILDVATHEASQAELAATGAAAASARTSERKLKRARTRAA